MHDIGTIKAINGWSKSAECDAILKRARDKKLKPVNHTDTDTDTQKPKSNDKN